MTVEQLLQLLIAKYPDRLPMKEVSPYALGKLTGQQEAINFITSVVYKEETKKNGVKKV